jgi:hypothetical protein
MVAKPRSTPERMTFGWDDFDAVGIDLENYH